jgi:hypothetical protein
VTAEKEKETQEKDELRQEIIKQCIILGFALVTLVLYTVGQRRMGEPDFTADVARKLGIGRPVRRDREKELLEQVQREISWMEHGIPDSSGPEAGGLYG